MSAARRASPDAPAQRGWCPGVRRPMPTGDGLLARVHPPLGILTRAQAQVVAAGARRFGNGHIDVTARANLQVRGVQDATRMPLARLLEAAGLGDARADGGPQRLTLTSPLADRDPAEAVDVSGLARAIEAAGRAIAGLPPKTLVAVAGRSGPATADADVVVRAAAWDSVAVALADGDGHRDALTCRADRAAVAVAALLAAFARSGRRRVRDLSDGERVALAAGWCAGPDASPPAPAAVMATRGCAVAPPAIPPPGLTSLRAGAALAVDAPFGRCTADSLDRLADAAGDLGADEIRLSPARGFVLVVQDPARAAAHLAAHLAALAADFVTAPNDPRRAVAACTGAPACASGTTPTLLDAGRLAEVFRPLAARGLSAHVSGCAKGCARPAPAALTLVGRGGAYGIVLNGAPAEPPALHLPIDAALERLGRAVTVGLAAAFAPDEVGAERGGDRRPA